MAAPPLSELAIWFPAFLLSLTCHEAAHAFTSLRYGDRTAENQASLNPIPHITREPIGTLVAPILSFLWLHFTLGWASAPYDPYWANRYPRRAALMSAAGPLANFVLAALALVVLRLLMGAGLVAPNPGYATATLANWVVPLTESLAFVARFLSVLFVLNLLLGFFNLLPLPPLDGSGLVRGFFPGSAPARLLVTMEERGWSFLGLLLAWLVFPQFQPVIAFLVRLGLGL